MKKTIGVLLKDIKKQRKTLSSMTDINKYLRNTSTGAGTRPAVGELLKWPPHSPQAQGTHLPLQGHGKCKITSGLSA